MSCVAKEQKQNKKQDRNGQKQRKLKLQTVGEWQFKETNLN